MLWCFGIGNYSHIVLVAGLSPCLPSCSLPSLPPSLLPMVVVNVNMFLLLQHLQCLLVVVIGDLYGLLEVKHLRIRAGTMPEDGENAIHAHRQGQLVIECQHEHAMPTYRKDGLMGPRSTEPDLFSCLHVSRINFWCCLTFMQCQGPQRSHGVHTLIAASGHSWK